MKGWIDRYTDSVQPEAVPPKILAMAVKMV
jgi:hypothetical protein